MAVYFQSFFLVLEILVCKMVSFISSDPWTRRMMVFEFLQV